MQIYAAKDGKIIEDPPSTREKNESKSKNEKKIFDKFQSPGKLDFYWPINMHKLEII